jgi:hypothetical protein
MGYRNAATYRWNYRFIVQIHEMGQDGQDTGKPQATAGVVSNSSIWATQQFSDEEGEVDEPLAPLPDEPDVVEGDEEIDLDETVTVEPESGLQVPETEKESQDLSKPPSPKPQFSMSLQPSSELATEEQSGTLDMSLNPFEGTMGEGIDVGEKLGGPVGDIMELDMSALAPDETDFVANLDEILGGSMIDQAGDPFATPEEE